MADPKQKKRTRRQHTVPKLHLRRFATEDEQLVGVRRETGDVVTLSLSDATVQKDFYSVETENGFSSAIEDLLGEMEGVVAPIIERMVSGEFPLDPESKGAVAEFIAFQWQRGTGHRENIEAGMDAMMKRIVGMIPPSQWVESIRESTPEDAERLGAEMSAFLERIDEYKFENTQNENLKIMLDNIGHVAGYFAARTWQLLEFSEGALLTSDDPVTLWTHRQQNHLFYGIGAANAQEVRMPLGRQHALVMALPSRAKLGEVRRVLGKEHASALNTHTASNAHRWIFHHPSDTPMQGLVLRPRRRIVVG